jgi:hypothetical protein
MSASEKSDYCVRDEKVIESEIDVNQQKEKERVVRRKESKMNRERKHLVNERLSENVHETDKK